MPDQELIRLTAAARARGSRWDVMAAACGIQTCKDLAGVIVRVTGGTSAELLFSAAQYAIGQFTGSRNYYSPLTWACPHCGCQVTDRAPGGRPAHAGHGHARGCTALPRAQAADDQRRHDQLPGLILDSEPAVGPVQRHWLRERITEEERYRILRALDAADRSVEPVRNDLPRPLAGVYHGMSGFAIARRTGPKPPALPACCAAASRRACPDQENVTGQLAQSIVL